MDKTFAEDFRSGSSLRISLRDTPEMKLKYAGINGRMQGERKESNPAVKAANKEVFSMDLDSSSQ
ncbi:MAG: hypothetical protein ACWGSD_02885 [Thermodesulfobacteriota bacterium]